MASNSKDFHFLTDSIPQHFPLSASVPIRAPLTLDDSEFDVSSNATLSDNSFSPRPLVPHPEEKEGSFHFQVYECDPLVHAAPLRVMPFAHLSTYDDDDDEEEEEEALSVVKVPGNFAGAPRIKVLDPEEENAESSMFMNSLPVSQSFLADALTFFDDDDEDLVVEEHGLDEVVGIRVAYDEYSCATDSDVMSQCSLDSFNSEQYGIARVVLKGLENDKSEGIAVEFIGTDTIMEGKLQVGSIETNEIVEGTSMMVADTSLLESNVEDCNNCIMPKQNVCVNDLHEGQNFQEHCMTDESVSEAFAEEIERSTTTQRNASECQNLVSITESVVNSKAELNDSSVGFEFNDDASEGDIIPIVEPYELFGPSLLQECTFLEKGLSKSILGVNLENDLFCDYHLHENVETLNLGDDVKEEANVELITVRQESNRDGSASDGDVEELMSVGLEQLREQISALSILLGSKGSEKNSQEELFIRSSCGTIPLPKDDAKGQLIYVGSGGESDGSTDKVTSADESSVIFLKDQAYDALAGLQHNITEKEKERIQKIHTVSVKFLRLVQRINLPFEDSVVSKVLCSLVADIEMRSNQAFVINSANISAKKLEENCQDDLDFSLNILVLGRSGVGKSATINSIFGDMKVMTNAFEPATISIKEVSGKIDGIKIRILDTPGLKSPVKEQAHNRKILSSIKKYMKKFSPHVILYVDRVDAQTRDLNDLPILRSITSSLGPSIWQHAILTLTHAASNPLDGPSGSPLSYEVFVAQKSYLVQQSITQAVGGLCLLSPSFMCPVALVENHPLCGKNMSGDCVLPNGLRWRSQLLALCFSLKIMSEMSSVSGPQTLFDHWKHFFFQDHSQPLCHVLSSLLQSPAHLKFSANWN